jgi:hypothetical protein
MLSKCFDSRTYYIKECKRKLIMRVEYPVRKETVELLKVEDEGDYKRRFYGILIDKDPKTYID